jgi:hypothetical protein
MESPLELPRFWGVGEEKGGMRRPGGFDGLRIAQLVDHNAHMVYSRMDSV